ncbi:MAG TPA: DegT/DnrJ/EryC1/StrS family aminotransferase [Polyangiaceae bacterium]|nr:DegT/DnrJ/EryC1/StrS family aminotransferase [Polyangiaceae bacterium]
MKKASWEDLAIFGGPSAFDQELHVGRPNIGDRARLLERFTEMLDRRWLSNDGPFTRELEARIAAFAGVKHCVAMCNATIALEIAIRALGLSGEVIIPSFTFIATAHALQWQEITPVFCDVDRRTHNINPGMVERLITPRTTGIIGVHVWGRPCDVDALGHIAEHRGLRLLYDAAHAFGCSRRGRMVGAFGDAEVYSFHATKFLNTFEGGAVVTNNDELASKIRFMKNFGFAGYDDVQYLGTNGKMTEVAALMGLTGLESLDRFIATNRKNYEQYQRELADLPGLRMVRYDPEDRSNYQYVVFEVDAEVTHISRDDLVRILWGERVLARRYFHPGCHRMQPYRSYFPHAGLLLSETEWLTDRVLVLPTGTGVTEEAIATICDIVRFAATNGRAITERMSRT